MHTYVAKKIAMLRRSHKVDDTVSLKQRWQVHGCHNHQPENLKRQVFVPYIIRWEAYERIEIVTQYSQVSVGSS